MVSFALVGRQNDLCGSGGLNVTNRAHQVGQSLGSQYEVATIRRIGNVGVVACQPGSGRLPPFPWRPDGSSAQ